MGKIMFCPHCFEDHVFKEIRENKTYEIRDKKMQKEITKYVCSKCHNKRILDKDYDNGLTTAINGYRKKS